MAECFPGWGESGQNEIIFGQLGLEHGILYTLPLSASEYQLFCRKYFSLDVRSNVAPTHTDLGGYTC